MIKSLLDADENPPPETAVIIEETVLKPIGQASAATIVPVVESAKNDDILEIPRDYQNASEILNASASPRLNTEQAVETNAPEFKPASEPNLDNAARPENGLFGTQTESFQPETTAETIRNSGLAYAAAVILLGSVIFMLILGWFADLIFGSQPWGLVGGIVLGSIIGFVQFFRTTSQILKK